jgi:hypothetical protein
MNGANGVAATTEKDQARIKDQRKLSLKDSFDLFVERERLAVRVKALRQAVDPVDQVPRSQNL